MSPSPAENLRLPVSRFVSGVTAAYMDGRHQDLLAPLELRMPGSKVALTARPGQRAQLADELARTNTAYGHPRAAELAAKLADPATVIVVAGQQAGLFGGPLFSLTKMMGAAKWAADLEAQGIPAVGVFWVATEDHDFSEIASYVLPQCEPEIAGLGDDLQPLMPVGMRTLGPEVVPLLEQAEEMFGNESAEVVEALRAAYRPDARIGEAFSKFMVSLLGVHSPLVLDSMLPSLKLAEAEWMRSIVERRFEVSAAFESARMRIEASGFNVQVPSPTDAAPLFCLQGNCRRRILWRGEDRFTLRGDDDCKERPVDELFEMLDENPAVISPGVLARPAIQDAVLGTALQLMGPGELAYMAQASAIYPVLGIDPPLTSLRPQMMVVPATQKRQLTKLGWSLEEALADDETIEKRLAGIEIEDAITRARRRVSESVAELEKLALEVDAQLETPWRKTLGTIDRALTMFSGKLVGAAARREETARDRVAAVRRQCLPLGKPQERTVTTVYYALRYGRAFIDRAWEALDVDSDEVSIVDPQGAVGSTASRPEETHE